MDVSASCPEKKSGQDDDCDGRNSLDCARVLVKPQEKLRHAVRLFDEQGEVNKLRVPAREKNKVLAALSALKPDIM